MIGRLGIRNFKCFGDQSISFRPLTLLAGANATGKSTVIQALLLLRQAFIRGDLAENRLRLNGDIVNIGEAIDAIHHQATEDVISFEITDSCSDEISTFSFAYERGRADRRVLEAIALGETNSNLFSDQFTYLSAERVGPRLSYPIAEDPREATNVGTHGEFAAHCLDLWSTESIASENLAFPNESGSLQLQYQTQLWMHYIAPDLQLKVQGLGDADIVQLSYNNHGVLGVYVRPTNMGFGISYALPIVVAALLTKPDNILIVENPEAHLHPAAQSRIGQFLSRAAANGVQVVMETHSDHLLNGIRLAAKGKIIEAEDVSVQFFTRAETESTHQIYEPKLDSDGRLDSWPAGFFDQADKDLLNLI
jgi:predicted ATPase